MNRTANEFLSVARWAVVRTTASGTASTEIKPKRNRWHRRGSMLERMDVRATNAELQRWKRKATQYSLSLSQYVRLVMNGGKVRVAMVADCELLSELRRQGQNLNQLMHAINAGYALDPIRVQSVLADMQALYRREIERG